MNNQIFVKIDEYNEVLNLLKIVNEKIVKAEETIKKIHQLKQDEEKELGTWEENLQNMKNGLNEMENEFFEK